MFQSQGGWIGTVGLTALMAAAWLIPLNGTSRPRVLGVNPALSWQGYSDQWGMRSGQHQRGSAGT